MTTSMLPTGFYCDTSDLFPQFRAGGPALPGEIVVRVHEDFSPVSLRNSDIGKQFISQGGTWYDPCRWANKKIPAAVYHLRLPVPGSNHKTFDEQQALLLDGEDVAPLVLVELAMLCLKKAGHPDPLQGGYVRCRETASAGFGVDLSWFDGRLGVRSSWGAYSDGKIWLAAVRGAS